MVEGKEKLRFPGFGLVTGFVSASNGNGKAQRLTARGSSTSLGVCGKDAIEGSFRVEADCVKDCFESAESIGKSEVQKCDGKSASARICIGEFIAVAVVSSAAEQ
jgi:hypothetical protein